VPNERGIAPNPADGNGLHPNHAGERRMIHGDLISRISHEQRRAADPRASAWVSANAGSGKTKVLSDRVLRLLLAGTPPGKILCLTFTKAAAANMAIRVFERLGAG
jgi:ATP-dependent exoDNAse (exonuclease V) beta subunit